MESTQQHQSSEPSNHLIAQNYLDKAGDRDNRILLTEQSLQLYYRGKSRAFSLAYVQAVALEHRKLWLPLIGGGILASLCLLALLHTFHMPYRLLTGAALGFFCMWWGYRGSMALVVYEQRHHTDFLIPKPPQSLAVFVAFANRIIMRYPQSLGSYCLSLSLQEIANLQRQGYVLLEEPRKTVPEEIALRQSPPTGSHWLLFNPYLLGERLRWSLEGQELQAMVEGKLEAGELSPLIY